MKIKIIFAMLLFTSLISCGQKSSNSAQQSSQAAESTPDSESKDDRISNATEAKRPKGKMSLLIDGAKLEIDENKVQCMYVGMNATMAQSVISGGSEVIITHMGMPKIGKIVNKGVVPSVGISVTKDGIQYMNSIKGGEANLSITKITPSGKNYYVAGTFSGKLISIDGKKSITVTNGIFESAYL